MFIEHCSTSMLKICQWKMKAESQDLLAEAWSTFSWGTCIRKSSHLDKKIHIGFVVPLKTMFENFLCRTRSKDAILQIVWNWIARKRKMCIHKDVESWTIHKDRCKFKVASNSDKITNLQHSSCTMSNFLEKSINHLSTRTNLPVHNQNPKNYWALHCIIYILHPAKKDYIEVYFCISS